jgi:hypothetical protein
MAADRGHSLRRRHGLDGGGGVGFDGTSLIDAQGSTLVH